ncbi:MAG: hypothetical protein FIB02_10115 [Desulfuromonas sp.]|nr:hypothetical protein [Desulfuromonas sp.]
MTSRDEHNPAGLISLGDEEAVRDLLTGTVFDSARAMPGIWICRNACRTPMPRSPSSASTMLAGCRRGRRINGGTAMPRPFPR